MGRREKGYLIIVLACALVFAAASSWHAADVWRRAWPSTAVSAGAAGEARDVDVEQIRELIRQGYLSDREASYYTPYLPGHSVPPPPQKASPRPNTE